MANYNLAANIAEIIMGEIIVSDTDVEEKAC